jgi:hypothetical protein
MSRKSPRRLRNDFSTFVNCVRMLLQRDEEVLYTGVRSYFNTTLSLSCSPPSIRILTHAHKHSHSSRRWIMTSLICEGGTGIQMSRRKPCRVEFTCVNSSESACSLHDETVSISYHHNNNKSAQQQTSEGHNRGALHPLPFALRSRKSPKLAF